MITIRLSHFDVIEFEEPVVDLPAFSTDDFDFQSKAVNSLFYKGKEIANNSVHEWKEYAPLWVKAKGDVLLTGLGQGNCIELIISKVNSIDVIEINSDIIANVKAHYEQKYPGKIKVIQADALEYAPTKNYDIIYHDCFIEAPGTTLLTFLYKRYKAALKAGGWQGHWSMHYGADILK